MKKIKSITEWTHSIEKNRKPSKDGFKTGYKLYNNRGDIVEDCWFEIGGKLISKQTYIYDRLGNLKKEHHHNPMGLIIETEIPKYNSNGKIVEVITKGTYTIIKKTINHYDKNGHLLEQVHYNRNKKIIAKSLFEYDNKGNLISEKEYDEKNGKILTHTTNKYDVNNNLVYTLNKGFFEGFGDSEFTFKYNEEGYETECIELDSNHNPISLTKSKYEFY